MVISGNLFFWLTWKSLSAAPICLLILQKKNSLKLDAAVVDVIDYMNALNEAVDVEIPLETLASVSGGSAGDVFADVMSFAYGWWSGDRRFLTGQKGYLFDGKGIV